MVRYMYIKYILYIKTGFFLGQGTQVCNLKLFSYAQNGRLT